MAIMSSCESAGLLLQFPLTPQATATVTEWGEALVPATPLGPGDDVLGRVRGDPEETDEEAPNLGDGDRDVERTVGGPPF